MSLHNRIACRCKKSVVLTGLFCAVSMLPHCCNAAFLIHDYQLNGSLADALGGPALIDNGGVLNAGNYEFGANQGPTLIGGLNVGNANSGNYSMEIRFSLQTLNSWRKLVDFNDRTTDSGLYTFNDTLSQVVLPGQVTGPSVFAPNVLSTVVITRSDVTNKFTGYVDGVEQFSVVDTNSSGIVTNNILHFFRDDFATGQSEADGGVLDYIRIYDGELTSSEVASLSAVPEPGGILLLGVAVAAVTTTRRFSRTKKLR